MKLDLKIRHIFLLGGLALILSGCFKQEEYPLTPNVSFNDFIIFGNNDSAQILINFTDGDGNIGLADSDTLPPYDFEGNNYYNLYLHYYEMNDSLGWVKGKNLDGDPIIFNFRLHPILPYNQTKGIQGTIKYNFSLFYNAFSADSDTIKYKFQIVDRDLNFSNFGESDTIIVS